MKHYDLVVLKETLLFPWDLAVPSTLGIDVNSFSLSSNGIKAGRPDGGITFIWHRDFGYKIQVKRYESDRILGLSVTNNGSSTFFINVHFPVACHEKYEEYVICVLVYLVPHLYPMKRNMYANWKTLMQHQVHPYLMKFVTCS